MTQIVRSLRGGQITIPAPFREELGIDADSLLQMTLIGSELRIRPVRVSDVPSDSAWLKHLYDHFSKVREKAKSYGEKEINQAIDHSVKAVRSSHD